MFLGQSQETLKEAHAKLTEKGKKRKAWALESFIIKEVEDGKRPQPVKRNTYRKGIARPGRRKERVVRPITV